MGSPHLEKQAPAHGLAGEEPANMKHSPRLVPTSLHLSCLLSGGAKSSLDYLHLYLLSLIRALFQVDLGKASTSQDRLERQLDILQVHQKQISDALNVMEAEAEHLSR